MALKISKAALAILGIAILGFGIFFFYLGTSVPGESEILDRIAAFEREPPPTSCPIGLERTGLLVEITRMAVVYTTNSHYKKATPFYARAVELTKKRCGSEYSGLLGPLLQLAESYDLERSPEKADPIYGELIVLRKKLANQREKEIEKEIGPLFTQEERQLLHSSYNRISGMLAVQIHMLQASGKANDAEPLLRRVEWLRAREKSSEIGEDSVPKQ